MVSGKIKWTAAILGSAVIHAMALNFYNQESEKLLIAGGSQIQVAAIGSSFENLRAMGSPQEEIEPLDAIEKTEPIKELDAEVIDNQIEPILALETTVELAEPASVVTQPEPVNSEIAKPVQKTSAVNMQQLRVVDTPLTPRAIETTEPTISKDQIVSQEVTVTLSTPAAKEPLEREVATRKIAALIPDVQNDDLPNRVIAPLPEIKNVPVPQKREALKPKPQKKESETKAKKKPNKRQDSKPQKTKTTKKSSGDSGKSKTSNKQGASTGRKDAKGKSSGNKSRVAKRAGNAAVSNYPGKIVRKLRRSIRYPKAAKRKKIRGEVLISFVISKTGNVNGIRIIRGSGSSILDEAALKTVRRAAPFPKIPDAAGKSRWAFKVPLSFN